MLSVTIQPRMLSVVILIVVMLCVVYAESRNQAQHVKCRYTERHNAECCLC
jgi:hypothetical protein